MKVCPEGAELFHADGQTDMTKVTIAFHNFMNILTKGFEYKTERKAMGKN
jgi:hypothetical protein